MKSEAPPNELVTADYIEMSSQTTYALNCRTGELHPYFRSGAFEVIRGRNVQAGDRYKTVISENLAKRNGLDLHDTFRVEIKEGMMGPAEEAYEVEKLPEESLISIHKVSSGQIELEAFQNISDICITGVCVCAAGTGSITVGFFKTGKETQPL